MLKVIFMSKPTGAKVKLSDPQSGQTSNRMVRCLYLYLKAEVFAGLLSSSALHHTPGDPGGDLPQPPLLSGGARVSISVPPVEGSGRQ